MIRNQSIRTIQTAGGDRYIYGPKTYRTLAEAQRAQAEHEAEYDQHIAQYREDGRQAEEELIAEMVNESPELDTTTITPEMRMAFIRRRGYRNILSAAGGDKHRAADLYRGTAATDDE